MSSSPRINSNSAWSEFSQEDFGDDSSQAVLNGVECRASGPRLASAANAQCKLKSPSGKIKHVVYIEFDNVHFTRDNPNVPSDLEQMPNRLNFLTKKGPLDAGDHTVLISHTGESGTMRPVLTTRTRRKQKRRPGKNRDAVRFSLTAGTQNFSWFTGPTVFETPAFQASAANIPAADHGLARGSAHSNG